MLNLILFEIPMSMTFIYTLIILLQFVNLYDINLYKDSQLDINMFVILILSIISFVFRDFLNLFGQYSIFIYVFYSSFLIRYIMFNRAVNKPSYYLAKIMGINFIAVILVACFEYIGVNIFAMFLYQYEWNEIMPLIKLGGYEASVINIIVRSIGFYILFKRYNSYKKYFNRRYKRVKI